MLIKVVKGFLITVAVLFSGIWLIGSSTASVTSYAEIFFDAISEGDTRASIELFHQDIKPSNIEFNEFVKANNLDDIQSYKVIGKAKGRNSSKGRYSVIKSKIKTADDEVVVAMEFRKYRHKWKIHSLYRITSENENLSLTKLVAPLPSMKYLRILLDETAVIFGEALEQRDMEKFRNHSSYILQTQTTNNEMMTAFSRFPKKLGVALKNDIVRKVSSSFSADPVVDEIGILHAKYFYHTNPSRVHFELKYVYEGLKWKLFGFKAAVKRSKSILV